MEARTRPCRPSRVIVPLGLGTALSLMGDATLYTVLPTHASDAGIALGSVGIVLAVNRAIRLVLNGPAGLLYDRLPRRALFVSSLFIGAASTALYGATRGLAPLLVGRLLWGLAWSGIWVGGATMILDVTSAADRGRWTGAYQTWFFLGTAAGAMAGGALTDLVGYARTMWIGAAATAVGAIAAWLFLPETRSARVVSEAPTRAHNPPGAINGRRLLAAAALQGINRFVIAGVVAATLGLLVQTWMRGDSGLMGVATATGALMAGRTVLSMGSAPLAGVVSDRMRNRWRVAGGAAAIGAAGMVLLASGGVWLSLVGILMGAGAGGGLQAIATTLTGDMATVAGRGRAIGVLHTVGDLGSALGPPIAYVLLPAIGLAGVYLLCAALFLAGLAVTLRFWGHGLPGGPIR